MAEIVVGIDLGTTTSAVACVRGGTPKVIPSRAGGLLTPSLVGFTESGEQVVGEAARVLAETHPSSVASATKRFLGRRYTPELAEEAKKHVPYALVEGPRGEVRVDLAGRVLPVTDVSARVLGELRLDAEAQLGGTISKAVITVPANFDDLQRQATREAARIAGLEVLRLVNEPTAAAVAYGLSAGFQGRALVFDLGGGTFDVSILEIRDGIFEVKATGGDPYLGGEDFDRRIVSWLLAQLPDAARQRAATDPKVLERLRCVAERAKRDLTEAEEAAISLLDLSVGGEPAPLETALTRAFFEQLSEPLSLRCLKVCEEVLGSSGARAEELDVVLLVGGMTRVPLIRRLVAEYFGREPANGINPDEAVALGAAIHASELAGKTQKALLMDVASLSLGVGVLGGKVHRLVQRNAPLPLTTKETFLPSAQHQKAARIAIFQGESDYCDEDVKLGEILLDDLRVSDRSEAPLEVTFELSTEGTLSVEAKDVTTGKSKAVKIVARTDLSPEELDQLRKQQASYLGGQKKEVQAEHFRRLLERTEKFARVLEATARENPSPEADASVARVRALLDSAKAARDSGDEARIGELRPMLQKLVTGA